MEGPDLSTSLGPVAGKRDEDSDDAVIAVDPSQRIVQFSKGAERLFGWRCDEVLGRPLDVLIPARFATRHRAHVAHFFASGELARIMNGAAPILGLRKDGREFPADATLFRLSTTEPDAPSLIVLRDASERERLRSELQASYAELERRVDERTAELSEANRRLHAEIEERRRTEAQLRESEAQLRTLLDNTQMAVYLKDLDGKYLIVNRFFEVTWRVEAERVKGKTSHDLFPPSVARVLSDNDRRVIAAGTPLEFQEHVPIGGDVHVFHTIKCPLLDDAGRPYALCGISEDVTEALRGHARNMLLAAIVDCSPDAIVSQDLDGRITSWNVGAEHLYGYAEHEVLGSSIMMLVPEECHAEMAEIQRAVRRGEALHRLESIHTNKGGQRLVIALSVSPVRDDAGTIIGAALIGRDVTEARRAEERLRESEASLAQAQRIAHLGNWERNLQTNQLRWSEEVHRIFGWGPGPDAPRYEAFLEAIVPADRPRVLAATAAAIERGQPYGIDYRIVRADGDIRFVHSQAVVSQSADGRPLVLHGTIQDVTELRQAETDLAARTAELARIKELDAMKNNFVNSVSHELRSPLTSIVGFAEFLDEEIGGPLSAQQRDFVAQIMQSTLRLRRLVDDLLDFARIDAGTFKLQRLPVDLGDRVRSAIESQRPQAQAAGLTLASSLPPGPLMASLDAQRIDQVLANLLGNAIKFTPPGGTIRITTTVDGDRLRCEVSDTGPGIAEGDRHKLFQRFSQLSAGERRGGTGLGLSIAKAIVEAHGGEIGVRSTPGAGSTFWFTLPSLPASTPPPP